MIRRLCVLTVGLAALAVAACRVTDLVLWHATAPPEPHEVECVKDVAYHDGPSAGRHHHLDLFLPKGARGFPMLLMVHGGAWIMGDNRCCGLHSSVGEYLASRGVGVAMPNYRLSPLVKHPEHVKDVARAFAWVKAHADEHRGRPDRLFLAGHSAGGHLVALLGTDEQYLKAEGLSHQDVRGVVALGGVYRIPPGKMALTLGGNGPNAARLDQMLPLRGGDEGKEPAAWPGIPLKLDVFGPAFGADPKARADASPLTHVRPGLPPFLLLSAERDLPTLPGMAEEFHRALVEQGCEATLLRVPGRNHNSILFRAIDDADPVAAAILDFIAGHL
jgi:acetyl esterase/lipase